MIEIYGRDNNLKCRIEPGNNSQQDKTLGGDNLLSLSFVHYSFVQLDVNDYCEFEGERYWLQERYLPTQKSEGEWSYDVKLYGIESLIKRLLVLKNPDGENEAVFTLTAPASEHVRLIVGSINAGMGNSANWKMGAVMATENLTIDYNGTYCDEGLRLVAEAAKTEWWVEGQTVNVCRCEHGEELTLRYPESITQLERDTADGAKFYTRLFPMGSSRNIDRAKYGSVRLQLPGGRKYVDMNVDKYGIFHHYEEAAFSAIYPRRVGTVSEVRETTVKGNDGKPFKIYWFKDGELPFNPNEYEIGGLVKHVVFQNGELNGRDFEVNYHAGSQEFEIITTWPYSDDIQLPGGQLVPKAGDKYILWNIRMPDEYYGLAEQEFLAAVEAFNAKHCIDTSVYKCPTHHVWVERNNVEFYVGRKIRLESEQYFPETGFRSSRITRISRSVALPSQMDIEISDATSTGAMTRITDSINEAKRYAREALGALPDIIRSGDTTKPTDTNLYSARRTHKEFLSKNSADTAQGLITFLRGIGFKDGAGIDELGNAILKAIQTLGFERTINGFGVWLDENGRAHGQIDYLEVIGKAIFRSLQIDEYKHIGGNIVLSGANAIINKVVPVNGGWKCYLHTDDGDKAITNDWLPGDQALCQTFNIRAGVYENVSNTYYWRCVSEVGQKTANEEAYIVITADEAYCDKNVKNDVPKAGDNVVLCGHNTLWDIAHGVDPLLYRNRMNVTMITTSKEEGGTIEVYRNIHDFSLNKGNAIFHLSSEKIFMNSRNFEWVSSDGERIPNVLYRGDWTPGTVAARYEAWYHAGGTWLSLVDDNADEPTGQSSKWKQYAAKGKDGGTGLRVEGYASAGSAAYTEGQTSWKATFEVHVWENDVEITDKLPSTRFVWERVSEYEAGDAAWKDRHSNDGYKINVTYDDLMGDTSFVCKFLNSSGKKVLTSITF
nr:MAG TPA: tail protein [Caudoviricetes sp.]